MTLPVEWPLAEPIGTARLALEPLRIEHADEMFTILDDRRLHEYIGGEPASQDELRTRYAKQVAGRSQDGAHGWLNWIICHRETQAAIGTVQATLRYVDGQLSAEIAWIIAVGYQHQGYATEAAKEMVGWLRRHGADELVAHIHPKHEASIGVAKHLGLTATDITVDGEARWESSRK